MTMLLTLIGATIFLFVVDKVYKKIQAKKTPVDSSSPVETPVERLTPGKVEILQVTSNSGKEETPAIMEPNTPEELESDLEEEEARKAVLKGKPKKKHYHNSKPKTSK